MPLAKIICKRYFHMSGEMVPPQYSPSDTTSARSPLAVVQSALVEERGHSTSGFARRLSSFYPLEQSFVFGFLMRSFDNQKITLRIATAVIANAIVAVTHTRYFRFSPKIPLPTRYVRSPLTTAQGAAVKERGHLTAALPYLAQARLGEIFSVPRPKGSAEQKWSIPSAVLAARR